MDQIANILGMSRSTLFRRLNKEGLTIRLIKEEKRGTKAIRLLQSTDLSVREIAETVGYSEPSAFHRTF